MTGEQLDLVAPDEEISAEAMAGWGQDRTVRGELIRQILLDRFPWPAGGQPDPRGVWLRGACLAGGLELAEVESRLPLNLIDCHTTATVRFTGSRLSTVDLSGLVGTNVVVREANIERSLMLIGVRLSCCSPEGTVNLGGAHIGAWVDLAGSHLVNTHADSPAFHGNNLRTGGGVFLNRGFRAEGGGELGTIRLSGATIGGQVNLSGASIRNTDGPAVVAAYLQTRSNLMLNDGFHAVGQHDNGTVRLVGARIGGRLMCENGKVDATEPGHLAVNISQVHVTGDVQLPPSFTAGPLQLTGLTYDGVTRGASLTEWLDLLANQTPRYASQPYLQLAGAHQAAGNERDVRRIHLARQRDLLRRGDLDFWGRTWHRVTGLTVGYGYRPTIALLWWAGTLALSILLIAGVAGPAGLVNHTSVTGGQATSCSLVEQVGLALNTTTPLVHTGGQQSCLIDTAASAGQFVIAGSWLLQALGWGFVTLFIAGFTGLVRKST